MLLSRINNVLCEDTPMNMFITCLWVFLDLDSGPCVVRERWTQLAIPSHFRGISSYMLLEFLWRYSQVLLYDDHENTIEAWRILLSVQAMVWSKRHDKSVTFLVRRAYIKC